MGTLSMHAIQLDGKIAGLLSENIVFTECFEHTGTFNEKITRYWFEYHGDKVYPFELSVKIDRNWLDDQDKTPIVSIVFSTIMAKNGQFLCLGNKLLDCKTRKKHVQTLYFRLEQVLLEELESKGGFGYKRDTYDELFRGYEWFSEGKAITSSGRCEVVPNLAFEENDIWESEEIYKQSTQLVDEKESKRYIRYFLSHNECMPTVRAFLEMVLQSGKEIRLTKEASFWNYTFVVRPDMLHFDSNTLSKLGKIIQYNTQDENETNAVMRYVFNLFSEHGTVNLCLDEMTIQELNEETDLLEKNPVKMMEKITKIMEQLQQGYQEPDPYQEYQQQYQTFLDGLLDLHLKYKTLYQQFGDAAYKRKAEKTKHYWLRYTN